jgi:hypothetical protein
MPRVLSDAMVSGSPGTPLTLATTLVQAARRFVRLVSAPTSKYTAPNAVSTVSARGERAITPATSAATTVVNPA